MFAGALFLVDKQKAFKNRMARKAALIAKK